MGLEISGDLSAVGNPYDVLCDVSKYHAILRSRFERDGHQYIQVVPDTCCIDYAEVDIRSPLADKPEAVYRRFIQYPSRVGYAPLWRFWLIRAVSRSYFFFSIHHVISDGMSIDVFWRAFSSATNGSLVGDDCGFFEYCVRQRQYLESGAVDGPLAEIKKYFYDVPIRPRNRSFHGGGQVIRNSVPEVLASSISFLARAHGVSEFTFWLAVLSMGVFLACGDQGVVIGVPTTNRRASYQNSIGYFNNVVLVPIRIDPDCTPMEMVERSQRAWNRAQGWESVPFGTVLEAVDKARLGLGRYMLNYQSAHTGLSLQDCRIRSAGLWSSEATLDADIYIAVTRRKGGTSANLLCRSRANEHGLRILSEMRRAVQLVMFYPHRRLPWEP